MSGQTGDTELKPQIPLATFQELVGQYHHRLLSLEADLKDRARSGVLPAPQFARRVRQLKAVHQGLNALQRLCVAETPGKVMATDIGLPVLDDCTPEERQVCERFLQAREADVVQLEQETALVYRWLSEAALGRTNPLKMTFRLSKLHRIIQGATKKSNLLQEAAKTLSAHVDKLLAHLKTPAAREAGRSTLDGLMTLFHQLDGTIARVARLRGAVHKEEGKVRSMVAWLREAEERLAARPQPQPPPTPLRTAAALQATPLTTGLVRSRKKRRLAEEYWETVIAQGVRSPGNGELLGAAALHASTPAAGQAMPGRKGS